ncbi:MAG: diacylglycerol kinase [Fibrobacter sp.]|jgi:diacylglycerol kinase family enzyme|nr:diacylglycerol kinase [Fibrobacter sp.]
MKRFTFLINPVSGGGLGKQVQQYLPEIMQSMNFSTDDWEAEFTTAEDREEQILRLLKSTETLIAVGGDGTVSSVFQVLLRSGLASSVKIGLIPLGTGNDLARILNLHDPFVNKGLLFLVRSLVRAKSRPFDIWLVNEKWTLANYFSSGIDARIAHDFNRDRNEGKVWGKSVFANKIHYVRRFFSDRNYRLGKGSIRIETPDEFQTIDISGHRTVIVGNIPSFASGSNPFYASDIADELLEVVPVPNLMAFFGAIVFGNIPLFGKLYKKYFLPTHKAKSLKLNFESNEFHQLDGEDFTSELGKEISIRWGSQVQMLFLDKGTL